MKRAPFLAAALLALPSGAAAQVNAIQGLDIALGDLDEIEAVGRTGAFPNGLNGIAMETTICNFGNLTVPWQQAMDPDHPFIAFLITREKDGRMEQISNLSMVKHGFFATMGSLCSSCQGGDPFGGSFLGLGCSDTYTVQNNSDNFWLGPSEEIDPWLGLWDPVCSFFDLGLNPSDPPNCNGQRSFSQGQAGSLGPVGNRVKVFDADLDPTGGALFYYQGHYILEHEPEADRGNNLGSRRFNVQWNGSKFNFNPQGPLLLGSVLQQWSGATVSSEKNGNDDGRFYVAVSVTGPTDGLYHYEYAIHNRDNSRGGGAFRIPICPGANVMNPFFKDVDLDGTNDWSFSVTGNEIVFSNGGDPQPWNSIFNFAFDSDAGPADSMVTIDQFGPGPGAASIAMASTAPVELFNKDLGPGCSNGNPPNLFATGTPPHAIVGNTTFGMESQGNDDGGLVLLLVSGLDGTTTLAPGCDFYMGGTLGAQILLLDSQTADSGGVASFATPVPTNFNLVGKHVNMQAASLRGSGGPFLGLFDLTNGLRVEILGPNPVPFCP